MNPIIFLDIDGVLNSWDWWARRKNEPPPEELMGVVDLDPLACQRLQRICAQTGAQLVISSTWRMHHTTPGLQELFARRGLVAPIIGRTPCLDRQGYEFEEPWNRIGRGLEIQWWLQNFLPSDEAVCDQRFAIIDDDGDMGDLRGKLVQTRMATGLTDLEGDYVFKHLSEPLMHSMAAGGKGRVLFKYNVRDLEPWWNRQTGPFGPEGWKKTNVPTAPVSTN